MLRIWRSFKNRRKARKALANNLRLYKENFPGISWEPFFELREFFAGKELSALNEQAFLYRLALEAPQGARAIEIGSWIGQSTCILSLGLEGKQARIYAIDAFNTEKLPAEASLVYRNALKKDSPNVTQREVFDFNLDHFGLKDSVEVTTADSRQAAGLLPLNKGTVDLLFIDGGHDLETVRSDIANYVPFVKTGGVVIFHDFHSLCGVPQAVWEAIKRQSFSELVGMHGTLIAFRK